MSQFPDGFVWGTATSAYQIEGAYREDGRGLSIWDAFCRMPGKVLNNENGDIACDHYHRYAEDVALMQTMGVTAYRFSISWSRLLPQGRGQINEAGFAFYDQLINSLLDNNIQPWVTLFHWDLPLALHLEMDGLLNPEIADYFAHYAKLCFERFGDRVKHWITLNEAWCSAMLGYGLGIKAPGHVSTVDPYIAGHNLLRAHGKIVDIYRRDFQSKQNGVIGISNNCDWREPKSDSPADQAAATRALEFFLGWFADPVYFGDYPESMRKNIGDRLPFFSDKDQSLIKDSSDFFGLNHYTTMLSENIEDEQLLQNNIRGNGGIAADQMVLLSDDPDWAKTDMGWNIVPWGCRKLLEWITERYNRPAIYITENGCAIFDDSIKGTINDSGRIDFLKGYLQEISKAIDSGVDVRGYFVWSLLDNFEWEFGYKMRFGLHYVDFVTGDRIPKQSADWYKSVIKNNSL
ncbi:MAG: beta-glucosidase [Gammaproteobacteria bacterium]|nr:beta-glucosidase [Gammaproteobacteria bacterium]